MLTISIVVVTVMYDWLENRVSLINISRHASGIELRKITARPGYIAIRFALADGLFGRKHALTWFRNIALFRECTIRFAYAISAAGLNAFPTNNKK